MLHPDRNFPKVKLGTFEGRPAVVVMDRKGEPFLWSTGDNHLKAIRNGIAFCDAAIDEMKHRSENPVASP